MKSEFLKRVSALFNGESLKGRKAKGPKRQRYGFTHSQPAWLAAESLEDRTLLAAAFSEFIDPHPATGNQFGAQVVPLSTGNVVITSPYDDAGGTDAGAVYLFNGATGALISTLTGSTANDTVGIGSVSALANGNYVVVSHNWANGAATFAGAVTWANGLTGVNGVVSSGNSLVGSTSGDQVGVRGVLALNNGNYVVSSSSWNHGAIVDAGAVTWGNGTTGVKGVVSAGNSLVGSKSQDLVGSYGSTALTNGNYVVPSRSWDNASVVDAGAVTWGNGTTGIVGPISAFNSLVGLTANDYLGSGGIRPLTNGNYVVSSHNWSNVSAANAGAVTWGSGTTGISGTVNATNSLIGTKPNDNIGYDNVTALPNGNYVVSSYKWDNGSIVDAGAVTWGNGTTGVKGAVGTINSLVGSIANDMVGIGRVTALTNGNYVVNSRLWNNGPTVDAGAVTWGNGTTGISGVVTSGNSLVGTIINDQIGSQGVTALTNGNYVVASPLWENVSATDGGAVTWGNGATGISGAVSSANSLVGTTFGDQVGGGGVTGLSNGHYVVRSPLWDNSSAADAGAVTWRNGTIGSGSTVSTANSLVGTISDNNVGLGGVTALTNGNYVVLSPNWDNGVLSDVGAVTWSNGNATNAGVVSNLNSLLGSSASDKLGTGGSVLALGNGNYVVRSPNWDNGALTDAGSMTFGSGTTGLVDVVSESNSARGNAIASSLRAISLDGVNQHFYGSFVTENSGRVRAGSQIDGFPKIAATIDSGNLMIDARDGNNNISVQAVGGNLIITDPGELFDPTSIAGLLSNYGHTLTIPLSSVTGSITVNGGRGDDTLTLDFTTGNPIPVGGFAFHGDDPAVDPGDALRIVGGNQGTVNYNYTNANDGSVVMSSYGTISYTGLEPILNTGSATNIIFNLPADSNNATLSDDGTLDNNLSRLIGSTFESTTFRNPSGSLKIHRGSDTDRLSINALPDFSASLILGTNTAPLKTAVFNGAVELTAGKSLTAYSETISTLAGLTTSGGAVSLNATDGITLNAAIMTAGGSLSLNSDTDGNGTGTLTIAAPILANWALPAAESTLELASGSADDNFGSSVAISKDGNTAIVAASADDIGLNVDQGSAAVFVQSGGVWIKQAVLTSLTGAAGDRFGTAVSLSADGNTAAIGAYQDDVGNDADEGSVTIFTRIAGVWSQQAQVNATDGSVSDGFGLAVDLSNDGNTLAVGAFLDDATNTDQGSVIVFLRSGTSWSQAAKLTASDNAASDRLGYSIAISGDGNTIIGGAYLNDVGTAADRGTAYVFTKSGSTWAQAQLLASDGGPGDRFGIAVDLSDNGNTALVGSYRDDIGSNTDQGSALVYTRSGTTWTQVTQKLTASDGAATDHFGYTVSLSGDGNTALVGLRLDDVGANVDQGSAAVFTRSGSTWTERNRLFGSEGAASDQFSIDVAINGDGTTLIAGAYTDDVGANANQGSATILSRAVNTPGGSLSAATGAIELIVADAELQGTINSQNIVTIVTEQNDRPIDIGTTTSGNLSLTDTELDRITAPALSIGDSGSGRVTISAAITRSLATNLSIQSGNHVFISTGSLNSGGGTIRLASGIGFGVHPMQSSVDVTTSPTEQLSFGDNSNLAILINGTAVDSQLRQLNVVGQIDLTGVGLLITSPYTPLDTDSLTIVVNDGSDPIVGKFNGLPEGATVNVNGRNKRITYVGGTGNDVVLLDMISPTILGTTPTLTGSTLPAGTTSLQITFSEPIVGGATAANFELRRAGADGLLGNADDVIVVLSSANFASFDNSSTLNFSALVEDVYRLKVLETIIDTVGNALDGDGNGIAGDVGRIDFVVQTIPDVLADPNFGTSGAVNTEFNYLSSRSDSASDVAVQTDGKIVIAGAGRVLRYNVNGTIDTTFGTSGSVAFPGTARGLAIQSDGKIVVVGSVQEYNYQTLQYQSMFSVARYTTSGIPDVSFSLDGKVAAAIQTTNDYATSVAIQSNGRIVVAGSSAAYVFNGSYYVSKSDFAVARFTASGVLDSSFDDDGTLTTDIGNWNSNAMDIAIQSNQRIVVVGECFNGTNTDFALARYLADGTPDSSFDDNGIAIRAIGNYNDYANSVAIQTSNGKIVVAGSSYNGSNYDFAVARFDVDGQFDDTFSSDGIQTRSIGSDWDVARHVSVQSSGTITVVGERYSVDNYAFAIARFTSSGAADNTFSGDGKHAIRFTASSSDNGKSAVVQSDGKIVIVGSSGNIALTATDFALARFSSTGVIDATFGTAGLVRTIFDASHDMGNAVAVQTDGKILVAGSIDSGGNTDFGLARYNTDGSLDTSFYNGGKFGTAFGTANDVATAIALQADGKIVVAGHSFNGTNNDFAIARYNSDGSLDSTFSGNGKETTAIGSGDDYAYGLAIQNDGRIVVVGSYFTGGKNKIALARYNANGTLDTSFESNGKVGTPIGSGDDYAYGVAIQFDGKIVIAGSSHNGSNNDFALVRYLTNGSVDVSFSGDGKLTTPIGTSTDIAKSIAIQSDGRIIAAGRSHNGNDDDFALARYMSNGSLDLSFDNDGKLTTAFDTSTSDVVNGLAVQSDGKIVAAGSNGGKFAVARFETNGSLDRSFTSSGKFAQYLGTGFDSAASGVAIQADGSIVLAGTSFSATDDFAILRLDPAEPNAPLISAGGMSFGVDHQGSDAGQLVGGPGSAFDGLNRLLINGNLFNQVGQSTTANSGQSLVSAVASYAGLDVRREVMVPNDGSHNFARTVESFTNTTATAISTSVSIVGNLGSDGATSVFATSDGDTIAESSDQWFGTDDGDGTGTPAVVHYIHGTIGLRPTAVEIIDDNVFWTYQISLAAGETLRLAHLTILGTSREEAMAAATALVTTSGLGEQAAEFLSPAELASLANFEPNVAPSNVALSTSIIPENQPSGTPVGVLSTVDSNLNDAFTYSFVSGAGDTGNPSFQIVGNVLQTSSQLDYEAQSVFSIRVRSTDKSGLHFDRNLSINVSDNLDGTSGVDAFVLSYSSTQVAIKRSVNGGALISQGTFPLTTPITIYNLLANDSVRVIGTSGNDVITMSSASLSVNGAGIVLDGPASLTLTGAAGNDSYRLDADSPLGVVRLDEALGGSDTVDLSATTTLGVVLNLGLATLQVVNPNLSLILGVASTFENATGGNGHDVLTGNVGNNILRGSAGNDTLRGMKGNDSLLGGLGNDIYIFDSTTTNESDTITETSIQGIDLLQFSSLSINVSLNLADADAQAIHTGRTLILGSGSTLENASGGSGNDWLRGNSLNNVLGGNSGHDILEGRAGNDSLSGGVGDDSYVFETPMANEADALTELPNGGTDGLVFALLSKPLNINLGTRAVQTIHMNRTLKLSSVQTFENITGGSGDDVLRGNSLANVLTGNMGNDVLVAGDGNDQLLGGAGRDILIGGNGFDTIDGGQDDDIVVAGRTKYDTLVANLTNLRTEWISEGDYATRVSHLRIGVGTTNAALKAKVSVLNDAGDDDSLTGGIGNDWFFRAADDVIADLVTGELLDIL